MLALAERGDLGGHSFAFIPMDERWDGERRKLASVDLHEISVVQRWPAYEGTIVQARARPVCCIRVSPSHADIWKRCDGPHLAHFRNRITGLASSSRPSARQSCTRERRSAPTSWDLMRGIGVDTQAGVPVGPHLAENLSRGFRLRPDHRGDDRDPPASSSTAERATGRSPAADHPVARLFSRAPNSLQTPVEFLEMMTAHCLLRGNAYCEIERDNRGAPIALWPLHPDTVSVLRVTRSHARRLRRDRSRRRHAAPARR